MTESCSAWPEEQSLKQLHFQPEWYALTNKGENGAGDLEPQAGRHEAPDGRDSKDCARNDGCEDELC